MITASEIHAKLAEVLEPDQMAHHYSDLYVKVTRASKSIVNQYEFKRWVTTFTDQITGTLWYDIPFCYDPTVEGGRYHG